MRILHLANHCRFGNGNVHAAVDLACEQVLAGHEVMFASGGGEYCVLVSLFANPRSFRDRSSLRDSSAGSAEPDLRSIDVYISRIRKKWQGIVVRILYKRSMG
jgi:DNA-binding response OmpR family regulator